MYVVIDRMELNAIQSYVNASVTNLIFLINA